ncbi:MAG: sigma-70 family RNA polymerase sigma factor [Candidatus Acidiferrum sp.]
MNQDTPFGSQVSKSAGITASAQAPEVSAASLDSLYARSKAERWYLSRTSFAASLQRSAEKRLASGSLSPDKLQDYLAALHLEDLALATACIENCEAAWEHFFLAYRGYLRSAAAAILRCSSASPQASELADSLFAELYGLEDGHRRERSLFRYFHGRSSLKTWLRAVLAQRHIDSIRAGRRFGSLDVDEPKNNSVHTPARVSTPLADPHRERYNALFVRALQAAFEALDSRDEQRLRLYYAEERTLAEIGKQLGEHESSVSRNLERIRLYLRRTVEETLRNGCPAANGSAAEQGLSDAQISLCLEYASADASFDLEKLLQRRSRSAPPPGRLDP